MKWLNWSLPITKYCACMHNFCFARADLDHLYFHTYHHLPLSLVILASNFLWTFSRLLEVTYVLFLGILARFEEIFIQSTESSFNQSLYEWYCSTFEHSIKALRIVGCHDAATSTSIVEQGRPMQTTNPQTSINVLVTCLIYFLSGILDIYSHHSQIILIQLISRSIIS